MADEVTDTWLVGVVAHDDALSSVRVHGGYLGAGPTSGRDHRVLVRIRFGDVDAPAFPDTDTSKSLLGREESLVAALRDDAVLIAVLTAPGFRDLVFHTGAPEQCRTSLEALGDADDVGIDVDIVADPAWAMYRSLFTDALPADRDRRRIHEAAAAAADSSPRCAIEHRFSFADLAEADQAAAALRDGGLEVVFEAADDVAAEAPPRFVVVETESLTQIDMARSRDALGGFATSWGGEYLGWDFVDSDP
ncbi:MAG TPA: DUF695 domain-containing protein [Acidimicrobiales bacterium]|nr:DUF695 domain-containing protein [Acidimicrobiales bacterium]